MTLFNKIKWVLGIALVFVVILTTNLIDRQNFDIVSNSIETIYADRLVAQDIIYDVTKLVGRKEVFYLTSEPTELLPRIAPLNKSIKESTALFTETKITPKEGIAFSRLKKALLKLEEVETAFAGGDQPEENLVLPLARVKEYLDELSAIQLEEGRRELYESKRAINSANLFTQLEIAVLIVMAIAIQVVILYVPSLDSGTE